MLYQSGITDIINMHMKLFFPSHNSAMCLSDIRGLTFHVLSVEKLSLKCKSVREIFANCAYNYDS
jgi:hypothetical protein